MNCEPLDDKLQIAWEMKGDMIEFELAGIIGTQKITIAVMWSMDYRLPDPPPPQPLRTT